MLLEELVSISKATSLKPAHHFLYGKGSFTNIQKEHCRGNQSVGTQYIAVSAISRKERKENTVCFFFKNTHRDIK